MERNGISRGNNAVIFTYDKSAELEGYQEMDEITLKLAIETEGYIGHEYKGDGKGGIFISYWKDEAAIDRWRKNSIHQQAKAKGKSTWYDWYHSMICKIEHTSFKPSENG